MSSVKQNQKSAKATRRRLNQQQQLVLQGQGDYLADLRQVAQASKQIVQSAKMAAKASKDIRAAPRKAATSLAKQGIRALIGKGDYHGANLVSNSLINPTAGSVTGAEFLNRGRRGTRVIESEYIGDVRSGSLSAGSTAFDLDGYPINPGNPDLFPWLSQFAKLYDQWEPLGIVFEYRTTSSTFNGTSQALGVVITSVDYDTADPFYSNKQEMENSDYAQSAAASESILLGVECDPNERLTRLFFTGIPPTGSSVSANLYNLGNFQIATQGMSAAGVTVGELWVHYDMVFYKKQLPTTIPVFGSSFRKLVSNVENLSGLTQVTMNPSSTAAIPFIRYDGGTGRFTFTTAGRYIYTLNVFLSGLTPAPVPYDVFTDSHGITYGDHDQGQSVLLAQAAQQLQVLRVFNATVGASFVVANFPIPLGAGNVYVNITQALPGSEYDA